MIKVQLAEVKLPEFGLPTSEPVIPASVYERRLKTAAGNVMWRFESHTQPVSFVLVVYADREHFANLAYLTGYDPRFEEALLIVPIVRAPIFTSVALPQKPILVVGNEGWGYAEISPLEHRRVLYQNFSLLGQPRGESPSLELIFREAGITEGSLVGVVGWKYLPGEDYPWQLDIPSYIADTLREITGSPKRVFNATPGFMDPEYGLRITNEVDQLAAFEFAATHASQALRNVLFGLRPGMTEYDAVRLMELNGFPHSAHLMLSSGTRTRFGLAGPSSRMIERGDPLMVAFGLWGGLNARAGFVADNASDLSADIRDYVEKLVAPYFRAIVGWYERVGLGVRGGELYDIVHQHIGDPFFGVKLNPGHYIHLDEWVSSPIYSGSQIELKSGAALQVDVIPATGTPYFTTNIEDGIALADESLRLEFQQKYPEAWSRIQARRQFMRDVLGIRLKPEVLPFSNIPAYLPPYLLNPRQVMTVIR
jgi:hypothetical protein